MGKRYKLLAIETSCDETAAAIVEFGVRNKLPHNITPASNIVASQIKLHEKYGGVYPELASRAHAQKIRPVVEQALTQSAIGRWSSVATTNNEQHVTYPLILLKDIDAIAVTIGPGLIGSLIVGVEYARGLALALDKPVIPINHLEGHIYACVASENPKFEIRNLNKYKNGLNIKKSDINSCHGFRDSDFPMLALVVSGGHTLLILMKKNLDYNIIGSTLDDAAGECLDKIARMLGLPYPGGPQLEALAISGNLKAFDFPRSMLKSGDYNFSFSGLKTAVFYKLRNLGLVDNNSNPTPTISPLVRGRAREGGPHKSALIRDLAASAQAAIIDVLVAKTLRAACDLKVKSILVGGGVSANSALRAEFARLSVKSQKLNVYLSPVELATDNALSIAIAGAYHLATSDKTSWRNLEANASLSLQVPITCDRGRGNLGY